MIDAAAAPAMTLVVSDRLVARSSAPGWIDALGLESVPERIGVVAAVAEQPLRFWQVVQQRCRAASVPKAREP